MAPTIIAHPWGSGFIATGPQELRACPGPVHRTRADAVAYGEAYMAALAAGTAFPFAVVVRDLFNDAGDVLGVSVWHVDPWVPHPTDGHYIVDLLADRDDTPRRLAAGLAAAHNEGRALVVMGDMCGRLIDLKGRPHHVVTPREPGQGLPVQPAEVVQLHDGPELQHLAPGVAPVPLAARQVAQERARRAAVRGNVPLPLGGLFDDVARAQLDLFA